MKALRSFAEELFITSLLLLGGGVAIGLLFACSGFLIGIGVYAFRVVTG